MVEIPADDILRFVGRYSIGRDSNPLDSMGSLHFLRIKIPGGFITSAQFRGLADIADKYSKGQGEITDRQDIQLHWISAEDSLEIFSKMENLGFATDMCGQGFAGPEYGDVRNIVCCPTSGIERGELIDPRPLLRRLSDYFIGNMDFHNMPRKFKISISGCQSDCTRAVINDLALVAVKREEEVGYTILAGGSVGPSLPGPRIAKPLHIFLRPQEAFDTVVAIVEIHRDYGNRESKAKARFKWIFETLGTEKFKSMLEERLGKKLEGYEDPVFKYEDNHTKIQAQRQDGLYYVNVPILGGRILSEDLRLFANLSDEYANGDLRLTPRQNLIIANINDREAVQARLEGAGFQLNRSSLSWDSVGCASDFCGKTVKPHCKEMLKASVEYLEKRFDIDWMDETRLRIHVSGCANNCCAKEIAGIGLSGLLVKEGGEMKQCYDIFLGGEFGTSISLARPIGGRFYAEEIPEKLESLIAKYRADRRASEKFNDFCNRHSIDELKTYMENGG